MSEQLVQRGPGRPKSATKREAILDAARELFLDHGYDQTSLELIASQAGVGKPTIYSHFGSKEVLFDAIIKLRQKSVLSQLTTLEHPTLDPAEDLHRFMMKFYEVVLTPESQRWVRLVIGESNRHPELAQKLFSGGPANVLKLVTTYITAQVEAGRLQVKDPAVAAEQLIGLMLGFELVRALMMSQPKRTKAELAARTRAAVDTFLAASRTGESS